MLFIYLFIAKLRNLRAQPAIYLGIRFAHASLRIFRIKIFSRGTRMSMAEEKPWRPFEGKKLNFYYSSSHEFANDACLDELCAKKYR